jgi:NADH:ubiquinone oxidoreductase subunit 6 (subunit J)
MERFLSILLIVVLVAIVAVLGLGVLNFARGGEARRSNRLMNLRVAVQAVAVVILGIILFLHSR